MSTHYASLFDAANIGALTIPNKLAVAPMTRISADADGSLGPLMKDYYQAFTDGGFGLIITEGLYTDQLYSQAYRDQPGITSQKQADSWKPLIEGIKNEGGRIIAQLMHGGGLSQFNPFVDHSRAPSAVRPLGEQMSNYHGQGRYAVPKVMDQAQIREAIDGFAEAARWAQYAGFDGVEIHGANGYLLDQFLTTYTNQREDDYGGPLANRLRIYREILQAVRQTVDRDFSVGVRFSQTKVNDGEYSWPEGEEGAKYIFSSMAEDGADFIHTTEPTISRPAFEGSAPLSVLAKQYSGLPIIGNGDIHTGETAAQALDDGLADILALGRTALANQDWPNQVRNGAPLRDFDFALLMPQADIANTQRVMAAAV